MALPSSWPAPAPDAADMERHVTVVGPGRALDLVAKALLTKRFLVHRVEALPSPPTGEWERSELFILDTAALVQLGAVAEHAQVLMLGTAHDIEGSVAAFGGATAERVDFVRVECKSYESELEPDVLREIVLRTQRLWNAGVSSRPSGRDLPRHRVRRRTRRALPTSESDLHDPESGRLDAMRVADFLGVKLSALADALGRAYPSVHKTPAAESLQEGLGPFARTIELLLKLHGAREPALAWLRAPHGELDERTPLSVMLEGRAEVVRDMLLGAYAGLPT